MRVLLEALEKLANNPHMMQRPECSLEDKVTNLKNGAHREQAQILLVSRGDKVSSLEITDTKMS